MKGVHKVRMRIIEVKKTCPRGHTAGEEWVIDGVTPDGICLGSFSSCMPYLTALRYGASFPWERRGGTITVGCPDHVNQVVWRLDRLGEDETVEGQ